MSARWMLNSSRGVHEQNEDCPDAGCQPVAVVPYEDREQLERLMGVYVAEAIERGSMPAQFSGHTDKRADAMQAALRKHEWRDGVVLVWNDIARIGTPIVLSRLDGKWRNHLGFEWGESDVEDALASRGNQSFRCGEVLREQAAGVTP